MTASSLRGKLLGSRHDWTYADLYGYVTCERDTQVLQRNVVCAGMMLSDPGPAICMFAAM